MKHLSTLVFALLFWGSLTAQHEPIQPYEELGIKVKVLTLSNGKYQESFPNDTLQRIGSVLFDRVTGEVVSVIISDTLYNEYDLKPEVASRWLSPDPLAHEYVSISPYAYVANNPISFIDPDGRNIVIPLTGEKLGGDNTREYQQTVFNHLQSLTNDKLGWGKDISGRDIVIIVETGTANSGKDLGFGTSLIASLIQSDDKHAFIEAPASSDQGNLTIAFSPNVNLQADGTAGEGASSWIRFNPNDTEGGLNVEGTTQRPANIGLAHELFHAVINMEGINITSQTHIESDPNLNQGNTISRTEFVTRFLENFIRQEQGEPLRVLPLSNNN